MPLYRALGPLFLDGRLIPPGERFENDGVPGAKWEPIDEAAKAAVDARSSEAKPARGFAATPGVNERRSLIEIPGDWEELPAQRRILIARSLGAPQKGLTGDKANTIIKDELARRATV